jgi:hypothetical protein
MEEIRDFGRVQARPVVICKSQIVWKSAGFVIFRDEFGRLQRYMPAFKKIWPVEVVNFESWEDL